MSGSVIAQQLQSFIERPEPQVIAIRGAWGIGKTHLWSQFIENNRDTANSKYYSYISLYGINDISAVKLSIFENGVSIKNAGTRLDLSTLKSSPFPTLLKAFKKTFAYIKSNRNQALIDRVVDSTPFIAVQDALICIDDLERLGSNLKPKDILGLATYLKEQRNCKVVILLNNTAKELLDYDEYREKTIDIELLYEPSPLECAEIAIEPGISYRDTILNLCNLLDITNIRVLLKINSYLALTLPWLCNFRKEVVTEFIQGVILFTWSYLSSKHNQSIPNISYIANYSMNDIKGDSSENVSIWNSTLRNFGFTHCDDLDMEILDSVLRGFFVEEELIGKAHRKSNKIENNEQSLQLESAWRLMHENLKDNTNEIVDAVYNTFKNSSRFYGLRQLEECVEILKYLNEEKKALQIIDYFFEAYSEGLRDYEGTILFKPSDPNIIEKLNQRSLSQAKEITIYDVFQLLESGKTLNKQAIAFLEHINPDSLKEHILRLNGPEVTVTIERLITFSISYTTNNPNSRMSGNVLNALKQIQVNSKIQKLKMKKFNMTGLHNQNNPVSEL